MLAGLPSPAWVGWPVSVALNRSRRASFPLVALSRLAQRLVSDSAMILVKWVATQAWRWGEAGGLALLGVDGPFTGR
jgi:hypothetical protein